jgi:hypothetical protein
MFFVLFVGHDPDDARSIGRCRGRALSRDLLEQFGYRLEDTP